MHQYLDLLPNVTLALIIVTESSSVLVLLVIAMFMQFAVSKAKNEHKSELMKKKQFPFAGQFFFSFLRYWWAHNPRKAHNPAAFFADIAIPKAKTIKRSERICLEIVKFITSRRFYLIRTFVWRHVSANRPDQTHAPDQKSVDCIRLRRYGFCSKNWIN